MSAVLVLHFYVTVFQTYTILEIDVLGKKGKNIQEINIKNRYRDT